MSRRDQRESACPRGRSCFGFCGDPLGFNPIVFPALVRAVKSDPDSWVRHQALNAAVKGGAPSYLLGELLEWVLENEKETAIIDIAKKAVAKI